MVNMMFELIDPTNLFDTLLLTHRYRQEDKKKAN